MFKANIFRHELRARSKSVLWWSLGIVGVHLLYMSLWPTFADQAAVLEKSLQQFPREFLQAFGMDRISMATVLGYYSLIFLLVQILLAIQASNYGVGLVSREESERTADFLMTKPVSRLAVITSKLVAAVVALLITQAVVWVSAFSGWALFNSGHDYDKGALALLLSSMVFFQLFFLGVGLAISLGVRLVRSVTPYALGLGLGMYVLGAFSGMLGDVKLEWLTPFKYFDAPTLIQNRSYDQRFLVLDLLITVAALAFAYWRYLHRDIPTVT